MLMKLLIKNVDNLLKEGGTLYPNTRDTIIKLSKKI